MTIYQVTKTHLQPIEVTSFATAGLKERAHLQQLLKHQIEVIAPDTLIISEEFGNWEDSRRRIDLLGVDKNANLVVIELKRTDDGGHMDLQAIRYAAMISGMTFDGAAEVFDQYLAATGKEGDARDLLLQFFDWDAPNEELFGKDVRVVLASAEFSREITTSVLWLNEHGLDIRCVRLRPHRDGERLLLDVQQVIPLPEAEQYQVRIRDKARLEQVARTQSRDLTKYDVTVEGKEFSRLPKRHAIYEVVRHLCDAGVSPEDIQSALSWKGTMLRSVAGHLDGTEFETQLADQLVTEGNKPEVTRYFTRDDKLIHANGRTYAMTKMWGLSTKRALDALIDKYPSFGISYRESAL